jgi:hypothetical protein
MEAEVTDLIGAAHGERTEDRVTWRNGYRPRRWDTRAGELEQAQVKASAPLFMGWGAVVRPMSAPAIPEQDYSVPGCTGPHTSRLRPWGLLHVPLHGRWLCGSWSATRSEPSTQGGIEITSYPPISKPPC